MQNAVNYTSYFARLRQGLPERLVPISISLSTPGEVGKMARYPALAPSRDILNEYKYRNGTWARYKERFHDEVLGKLDARRVFAELVALTGGRPFALCCYEADRIRCHRSLVADWLNRELAGVPGWQDIVEMA